MPLKEQSRCTGETASEKCVTCEHLSELRVCTHHDGRLQVKQRPVWGECTSKTHSLVTCCDLCEWNV